MFESAQFDVGIHYMGGQLNRWSSALRMIFAFVSDGKLEWSESDAIYDLALNRSTGERIPFTKDHARNNRHLLSVSRARSPRRRLRTGSSASSDSDR